MRDEPIAKDTTWILVTVKFVLQSLVFFVPKRIVASWQLCGAVFLQFLEGERYKENKLSLVMIVFAFILPEISTHAPINYLNSVSLGHENN